MPSLYRRSSIFMDARNVMVATDAIVAWRWFYYMRQHPQEEKFFTSESKWMDNLLVFGEIKTTIMATKQNRNFLLDYFDWNIPTPNNPVDPYKICEIIYKNILSMEPVSNADPLWHEDLELVLTGIGASLKNLIKDSNLNKLHIYLDDTIPKTIEKKICRYLNGSQKLYFVRGDKKTYFEQHLFDSYFFEDVIDIDAYLTKRHPTLAEILVPASTNNLSVVGMEGNTGLRLVATNHTNKHYNETIHANIFTIQLPI